jgi:arylsulfate sulfotransferase
VCKLFGIFLAFCCSSLSAAGAPVLHLLSTLPSPQLVGTSIGLMPKLEIENPTPPGPGAPTNFQYSVSVNGGPFHIVRDFSQMASFAWTPDPFEQKATVRLILRDGKTKATLQADLPYEIVSRAKGKSPVVAPTSHPLVALFSAPPCATGTKFRVAFHADGEASLNYTPAQPCQAPLSSNVYVAGMRAETKYLMREELMNGTSVKSGSWLPFQTGMLDGIFPPLKVTQPRATPSSEPVVLYSSQSLTGGIRPFASDLQGHVLWYLRTPDLLTRVLPGGHFLVIGEGSNSVNSTKEGQILREIDLAGHVVSETNTGRLAEQLEPLGIHSDCKKGGKECVSGLHHEALRLPNGHYMVIAGLERIMPAGTQGAKEAVDILGDVVIDLNEDMQVTAAWNTFDHLDIKRKSLLDAKCRTGGGGCPPVLLMDQANGWTHSNSLNYIPATGDFLVSMPEQDWVLKVDWKNGKGSGKILWRLGNEGDFKADSSDPNPWFSYQHDAGFEPLNSNLLTVVDDVFAITGKDKPYKGGVRAQTWQLDEDKHIAKLIYNAETGLDTICCGSMQILKDGGYSTQVGWHLPMNSRTVETDKNGKIVFAMEMEGVLGYRSFRLPDMYSAPVK